MMKTGCNEGFDVASRLRELKAEFEQGQAKLIELDKHRQELRDGLLRISGAIQILEELSNGDAELSVNMNISSDADVMLNAPLQKSQTSNDSG